MRNLTMNWQHELTELQHLWREEPNPMSKSRLSALMLLRQGHKLLEVAEILETKPSQVRHVISAYQRRGVIHAMGYSDHRDSRLTFQQQRSLVRQAQTSGFATLQAASAWIDAQWGICFSVAGLRTVFERLSLKTTTQQHLSQKRVSVSC